MFFNFFPVVFHSHKFAEISKEQQKLRSIKSAIGVSSDRAQILQVRLTKVESELKQVVDEKSALIAEYKASEIRLRASSSENEKLRRINAVVMGAKLSADDHVRSLKLELSAKEDILSAKDDLIIIEQDRASQLQKQLGERDRLIERIKTSMDPPDSVSGSVSVETTEKDNAADNEDDDLMG